MFQKKVYAQKTGEDWSDKLLTKGLPIAGAVAGGIIGGKMGGPAGAVGGSQAGQQLGTALGGLLSDDPYSAARVQSSLMGAPKAADTAYETYLRRKANEAQTNPQGTVPQQQSLAPVKQPTVAAAGPEVSSDFGAGFGDLPYPTRASRYGLSLR